MLKFTLANAPLTKVLVSFIFSYVLQIAMYHYESLVLTKNRSAYIQKKMKTLVSILILIITLTNAIMPESDFLEMSPVSSILDLNTSYGQVTYFEQSDLSDCSHHEHSTDTLIYHACHLGHCGFEIPMPFEKLKQEKSFDYFSMVDELTSIPSKLKKRPPKV